VIPRRDLIRLLNASADRLDEKHPMSFTAWLLREAARAAICDRDEDDAPQHEGCPTCGKPIQQPPTGRRRRFCSDPCRKNHRRNATKEVN
jgi:hypothetical protein